MKMLLIISMLVLSWINASGQTTESGIRLSTDDKEVFVEEIVMVNLAGNANETLGNGELLIYPLITSTVINVIKTSETKKVYTGRFVDITNKIVKTVELDALHNEINLKGMDIGDYLLRITSGDKQITEIRITKVPGVP
jgi:hypothetical protein